MSVTDLGRQVQLVYMPPRPDMLGHGVEGDRRSPSPATVDAPAAAMERRR